MCIYRETYGYADRSLYEWYIMNQMYYPLHILIKTRAASFNDAQFYFTYKLLHLVMLRHIRSESVSPVWMVFTL